MSRLPRDEWFFAHRVELASLAGGVGFAFYLIDDLSICETLFAFAGFAPDSAMRGVYVFLALLNVFASALRIWAGAIIGGERMMSVAVRTDDLIASGPYAHVRNPIYLSDLAILAGMGLVVPWSGSLVVWGILAFVYPRVMRHEEAMLGRRFGSRYLEFCRRVPRLIPRFRSAIDRPRISPIDWREGARNNFLYVPLVPGFVVCAATGRLWHGVAVGAAGPVFWVALHFWRNFGPAGLARPKVEKE